MSWFNELYKQVMDEMNDMYDFDNYWEEFEQGDVSSLADPDTALQTEYIYL